jgi:L-rhamnose-H+ transport protein
MGSTQTGKYDYANWSLHMAFFIIASNAIGLSTGEWRGSSRKTLYTIVTGIVVLIVSTVIFGCGA